MRIYMNVLLVWLIGLILLGLGLWSLSMVYAANPGGIPLTNIIADDAILVEDFEHGDYRQNRLGGEAKCEGTTTSLFTCTNPVDESNGFLQMQYDVSKSPSDYVLYTSDLINRNLTEFDTVWFAIKGEKGSEPIEAELVECEVPAYPKQLINNYLAQGIITSEWSAAAIPISSFGPFKNQACMFKVNVLARNGAGNSKGTIFVDDIRFLPDNVLLDNFDDTKPKNELGGDSGIWPNDGSITYSYPQTEELKLDYDIKPTNPFSEAVYWTKLRNTNLLSRKDALSFKIHGSTGAEVAVQLMDCGLGGTTHQPIIKVSDYLRGGISAEVQDVTIPLAAFADGIDWRCAEEFKFLFSAYPWINSGYGTIYIDNIIFAHSSQVIPLFVDHFDDGNNWNVLLGAWGSNHSGNASIDYSFDNKNSYGNNGYSLRITYSVVGDSAAWIYSNLKGIDVRDYSHLRFFLKGAVGNEELHIRLIDSAGKYRIYDDIRTTNNWQEILIPLNFFSSLVDLAKLSELSIAFEWKTMSGTIFLDDLSFIKPQVELPIIFKGWPSSAPPQMVNLYLRNHTGSAVSYTVHGIGTKTVPSTLGGSPFFWGSFSVGTYQVSWYKISNPSCKNSGTRTYLPGDFEPSSPMICF